MRPAGLRAVAHRHVRGAVGSRQVRGGAVQRRLRLAAPAGACAADAVAGIASAAVVAVVRVRRYRVAGRQTRKTGLQGGLGRQLRGLQLRRQLRLDVQGRYVPLGRLLPEGRFDALLRRPLRGWRFRRGHHMLDCLVRCKLGCCEWSQSCMLAAFRSHRRLLLTTVVSEAVTFQESIEELLAAALVGERMQDTHN